MPIPRGRAVLMLVLGIFAAPVLAAWLLYVGPSPARTVASADRAGMLFRPVQPLVDIGLRRTGHTAVTSLQDVLHGHWTLMQVADSGCGRGCRASLVATHHARGLLHRDAMRVQRLLLVAGPNAGGTRALQPDLAIYRKGANDWQRLVRQLTAGSRAPDPATVYLVDPLGNVVLYYPAPVNGKRVLDDLSRLLRLSQIG